MIHVLHAKEERVLLASTARERGVDAPPTPLVLPHGVIGNLAVETARLVAALLAYRAGISG